MSNARVALIATILVCCLPQRQQQPLVAHAVEITHPPSLAMQLRGASGLAAFGPPYTTTRLHAQHARVALANPITACSPLVENEEKENHNDDNSSDVRGKIALIHRGGCSFAQKALAAQRAGAVGCLFVNVIPDLKQDPAAAAQLPNGRLPKTPEEEYQALFFMSDDGNGYLVKIPVELVTETEGRMIERTIAKGKAVKALLGRVLEFSPYVV